MTKLVLCLVGLFSVGSVGPTILTPRLVAQDLPDDLAAPMFMTSGGFCPEGVFRGVSPHGERPEGSAMWGSFCVGDADTGRIESAEFLAPATISMYLSGYPGSPGRRVALVNVESLQEIELRPKSTPGAQWQLNSFNVPADWVGKRVQMIAEDQATGRYGWLGFTEPLLPYSSLAAGAIATNRPQGGFCPNGVQPTTAWPTGAAPSGAVTWGSYCKSGDNDVGWMASKVVTAESYITLYLAGYPGYPNLRLVVENLQTGYQLPLRVTSVPKESWQQYHFPLPSSWKGQRIRVLAEDKATGSAGWIGFTDPIPPQGLGAEASVALRIIGLVFLLFVALVLPAAAAAVVAFLRGVKDPFDLTAVALLAIAFVGYGAFWIYFFSRGAGITYSYTVLLSSLAVIVYAWVAARKRMKSAPTQQMIEPWVLVILASVFVISLGLIYGHEEVPLDLANYRFAPPILFGDNYLPKYFADAIFKGHIPRPIGGDWLSSDRPPLQTGLTVWNYAWTRGNRELPYQVVATILQLTFLVGLWMYLRASRVNRKAMALTLGTALFSGFALVNSFFTWPKLFPVAFLLIIAAYLLTDRYYLARTKWRVGALIGAAAAFAMLCHGGSIFALLGIGVTLLVLRRLPERQFLLAAACVAVLLYLPWNLYQKYYDPPGDRLLKWHLAGTIAPHPEVGLRYLLVRNYRALTVKDLVRNKTSNFILLAKDGTTFWKHTADLVRRSISGEKTTRDATAAALRASMFYVFSSSLDFLGFAPIVLLLGAVFPLRHSPEFVQAWTLWLCNAIVLCIWCLLMFGPSVTYIYLGCYFTEVAALAGSTLAFWAISPRLALIMAGCHILLSAVLFVWLVPVRLPGTATFTGQLNSVLSWTCIVAAGGIVLALWRMARSTPEPVVGEKS